MALSIKPERRREKEKLKIQRKQRAESKKEAFREKLIQKKITDQLQMWPDRDRERFRSSEKKIRRLELKEAKENLWRGRRREESGKECNEDMGRAEKAKRRKESEEKINNLDIILERIRE